MSNTVNKSIAILSSGIVSAAFVANKLVMQIIPICKEAKDVAIKEYNEQMAKYKTEEAPTAPTAQTQDIQNTPAV